MHINMMYYMIDHGISFSTLSANSGINEEYLRDIARGKVATIKVKTIRDICSSLHCSVEELFGL